LVHGANCLAVKPILPTTKKSEKIGFLSPFLKIATINSHKRCGCFKSSQLSKNKKKYLHQSRLLNEGREQGNVK
jgi:hypothetical protein